MNSPEQPMEPGAGNVGLNRRSHDRLYYNARRVVPDVHGVEYLIDRMVPWVQDRIDHGDATRVVGRFLMPQEVLVVGLRQSSRLRDHIEAAVPVGSHDGQHLWMTMFALNHPDRRSFVPIMSMQETTDQMNGIHRAPAERIVQLRQQGYWFTSHIDELNLPAVYDLWGPIFGWSFDDVAGFPMRLASQQLLPPHRRSVWFSGVTHRDAPVALSMAERLDLPIRNGEVVSIVESTEWCVAPGWEQRGLASASIAYLHAQVMTDLRDLDRPAIIIAETNFASGAHGVGFVAGMRVPPRFIEGMIVPQILQQNVSVGDRMSMSPLRDFTMMYLPQESILQFYTPEMCGNMLEEEI